MNFSDVYLDTHPLGLVSQRPGKLQDGDHCRAWLRGLLDRGVRVVVPAVADYEVRRELIRTKNTNAVSRLTALREELEFLPVTQAALERAAELWAEGRNTGRATADPHALYGDAILSAQVLLDAKEVSLSIVATINVKHISRYVPNAIEWQKIVL